MPAKFQSGRTLPILVFSLPSVPWGAKRNAFRRFIVRRVFVARRPLMKFLSVPTLVVNLNPTVRLISLNRNKVGLPRKPFMILTRRGNIVTVLLVLTDSLVVRVS